MLEMETLRPRITQPGVLSFEAWMDKTDEWLVDMKDHLEFVLASTPPPPGMTVHIDRDAMYDAFFRYVYRTSVNRYRSYKIIY